MIFLNGNKIKIFNYAHTCVQNQPTNFEFKFSNETKSTSTDLDSNGNLVTVKIKDPTFLKMRFYYESEVNRTVSQDERMLAFKKSKKEERRILKQKV